MPKQIPKFWWSRQNTCLVKATRKTAQFHIKFCNACSVKNFRMEANSWRRKSSTWDKNGSSQTWSLMIFRWLTASTILERRESLQTSCSSWKRFMLTVKVTLSKHIKTKTIIPRRNKWGLYKDISNVRRVIVTRCSKMPWADEQSITRFVLSSTVHVF